MASAIPWTVLEALEAVRSGGLTNMAARRCVIDLVREFDDDSADWLAEHPDRYLEALRQMGERRVRP